jgi:hypothetical protein
MKYISPLSENNKMISPIHEKVKAINIIFLVGKFSESATVAIKIGNNTGFMNKSNPSMLKKRIAKYSRVKPM